MNVYDFTVLDTEEKEVSLSDYEGKVLLIVNTATGCKLTAQYKGLQTLYEKYRDTGFEILDFPCNQFRNEAPGTNQELADFCVLRFGTTFRTFAKIEVNGKNEAPLYTYLKSRQDGVFGNEIKWNFTKFLIDRKGDVIKRFSPFTTPQKIDAAIAGLI